MLGRVWTFISVFLLITEAPLKIHYMLLLLGHGLFLFFHSLFLSVVLSFFHGCPHTITNNQTHQPSSLNLWPSMAVRFARLARQPHREEKGSSLFSFTFFGCSSLFCCGAVYWRRTGPPSPSLSFAGCLLFNSRFLVFTAMNWAKLQWMKFIRGTVLGGLPQNKMEMSVFPQKTAKKTPQRSKTTYWLGEYWFITLARLCLEC